MSSIDSITFSITRTSYPTGHICSIDYSYFLRLDNPDLAHNLSYNVTVSLYGDDVLRDKQIGDPSYDSHIITVNEPMPIKRNFALPCEVLDEAVGKDKVFIQIYAVSNEGKMMSARSETVKDWF